MPLRRRYKLKHWFWGVAWIAVLLGVRAIVGPWSMAPLHAAVIARHWFPMDNVPMLYAPGAVAVSLSLLVAIFSSRFRIAGSFALLAAAMAMIYPEVQAWYVWNVMRDHTANIGYGILKMGLPLTAPAAAILAGVSAAVLKAIVWEAPSSDVASLREPGAYPPIM